MIGWCSMNYNSSSTQAFYKEAPTQTIKENPDEMHNEINIKIENNLNELY